MKKKICDMLAKSRNPHEIARVTGTKVSEVRKVMKENPSELSGWGRPVMQPHIISRRRVLDGPWPAEDSSLIIDSKRLHDQGRVTMCQGRDGPWVIQYAVPMSPPVRRPAYFYGG